MSELTIPAAVWAHRVDGVPLVAGIVEGGRRCDYCIDEFGPGKRCQKCGTSRLGWTACPPADLVALRDARCETCNREPGLSGVVRLDPDGFDRCPNPGCVDGRLLHQIQIEGGGSVFGLIDLRPADDGRWEVVVTPREVNR